MRDFDDLDELEEYGSFGEESSTDATEGGEEVDSGDLPVGDDSRWRPRRETVDAMGTPSTTGDGSISPEAIEAWLDGPTLVELQGYREQVAAEREARKESGPPGRRMRELPMHLDHRSLAQTGWALVLAEDAPKEIEEALEPLTSHRNGESQAADIPDRPTLFRLPRGANIDQFMRDEMGSFPGTLKPRQTPYYLLLAGTPDDIPFQSQYQLQTRHAVGRLPFTSPDDYHAYAKAVVKAETEGVQLPEKVGLFSVEHEGDAETARLSSDLVAPLYEALDGASRLWEVEHYGPERATRAQLLELLGGDAASALLLVACHGYAARGREDLQGALICSDWPGKPAPLQPSQAVAASDLAPGVRLDGQIAVTLACYGAGTPKRDAFGEREKDPTLPTVNRRLARRSFVAELPTEMLRRGALAVLAHVDRGWLTSVSWRQKGRLQAASTQFEDLFLCLLQDFRLGHAMRPLVQRYKELGASTSDIWESHTKLEEIDKRRLRLLKLAVEDARRFVILGDPAVRARGRRLSRPRRYRSAFQP